MSEIHIKVYNHRCCCVKTLFGLTAFQNLTPYSVIYYKSLYLKIYFF